MRLNSFSFINLLILKKYAKHALYEFVVDKDETRKMHKLLSNKYDT